MERLTCREIEEQTYPFGRCMGCGKEFNSELINEYDILYCPWCGNAISEDAERENPQPLTVEQLRERDGKPVYCVGVKNKSLTGWGIINVDCYLIADNNFDHLPLDDYGKLFLAYDHEPKEVSNEI